MQYPNVLSEQATIERALTGKNLSRFGDGELRLATGGGAKSQLHDSNLAGELREILTNRTPDCLVCLPRKPEQSPKQAFWNHYADRRYLTLYGEGQFGSSFVTRPDSAPWIDTPDYWRLVSKLWHGRDVILVAGDRKSLTADMMTDGDNRARSVTVIPGPPVDAYADIDSIDYEITQAYESGGGIVLMCLGATATVLAARLAKRKIWAIDMGHIGMFMRHAGSFNVPRDTLISDTMLQQNKMLHSGKTVFGADGHKHADVVLDTVKALGAGNILDYGCGKGELKSSLRRKGFAGFIGEYDPAIPGKDVPAKPADLVVSTDVLEHVEPELLDNVLRHIVGLASKGCYLVIATRPANTQLPQGGNAHLIVKSPEWWSDRIDSVIAGIGTVEKKEERRKGDGSCHEVRFWIRKSS